MREPYNRVFQKWEDQHLQWTDRLLLLADMMEVLEMLERCVVEAK